MELDWSSQNDQETMSVKVSWIAWISLPSSVCMRATRWESKLNGSALFGSALFSFTCRKSFQVLGIVMVGTTRLLTPCPSSVGLFLSGCLVDRHPIWHQHASSSPGERVYKSHKHTICAALEGLNCSWPQLLNHSSAIQEHSIDYKPRGIAGTASTGAATFISIDHRGSWWAGHHRPYAV